MERMHVNWHKNWGFCGVKLRHFLCELPSPKSALNVRACNADCMKAHNYSEPIPERLAKFRVIVPIAVGTIICLMGVAGCIINWVSHGGWTVSPWIFVSVVLTGIIVIILPRITH
jgi:hypothetical protein